MTSARTFYMLFMKLAKIMKKSNTRKQLSRNVNQYVQPLANCFDDDGLDVMDDYHLVNGDIALDNLYPILQNFSNIIHKHYIYEMTTIDIPLKSNLKLVNFTHKRTYAVFTYPSKELLKSYMIALLNMAMMHTINHFKYNGVRWADDSYITPFEEYQMRIIIGIKTSKNFIKPSVYIKHYKFLNHIQNIHHSIVVKHMG